MEFFVGVGLRELRKRFSFRYIIKSITLVKQLMKNIF